MRGKNRVAKYAVAAEAHLLASRAQGGSALIAINQILAVRSVVPAFIKRQLDRPHQEDDRSVTP